MISAAKTPSNPAGSASQYIGPQVQQIRTADLADALRSGLADFNAAPTHAIFICLIYPIIGLMLARATFSLNLIPLLFPAIAGFAIIGPFAAIGLYEISRLREQGAAVTWRNALDVIHARSIVAIVVLGAVLMTVFGLWIYTARELYGIYFGEVAPASLRALFEQVLTTRAGWEMMIIGDIAGAIFAIVAFAISVVSFPLLIDRDADVRTAILTSVRAVAANPVPMMLWGLIVVAALVIGSLPALIGLVVVMPILGHATWHLYRKLVV